MMIKPPFLVMSHDSISGSVRLLVRNALSPRVGNDLFNVFKLIILGSGGDSRVESRLSTAGQAAPAGPPQPNQTSIDAQINPTAGLNLVKNILG